MRNEITKKGWGFWAIFTLLVVMMGFIMTITLRMATKADVARIESNIKKVETDLKADIARIEINITEIRTLLIDHIKDGHNHRRQSRRPASKKNNPHLRS